VWKKGDLEWEMGNQENEAKEKGETRREDGWKEGENEESKMWGGKGRRQKGRGVMDGEKKKKGTG